MVDHAPSHSHVAGFYQRVPGLQAGYARIPARRLPHRISAAFAPLDPYSHIQDGQPWNAEVSITPGNAILR